MTCATTTDPQLAARILRNGGLVALPTETVYGLGADATNPIAVAKIFAAKDRPFFDPLIVHIGCLSQLENLTRDVPPLARKLAERFWPGPLTLLLPKTEVIPEIVTSGLPTVGLRMPRHPAMQRVLELANCPIAAPSANPFGRLSPTRADHVAEMLGNKIDLILDGGPCEVGVESTIVRVEEQMATILRLGGLPPEEIGQVAESVRMAPEESPTSPLAPGMLPQHYAPKTPIRSFSGAVPSAPPDARWGLISTRPLPAAGYAAHAALSPSGSLVEAAARFFEELHRLDRLHLDQILAERFPDQGLGKALNDRLGRAEATR